MTKFLRLPVVIERTGLSRSTIYEMMDRNEFPRPVKIGARAIAWPSNRLDEWIADKVESA
tara:strand:- start:954 stop:1133 length:180 start_codon:yes stop_codon:yes gene_type:complete